jgi:hypothetical protein
MAILPKEQRDIKKYLEMLDAQYKSVSDQLCGSNAERKDAQKYYNSKDVWEEDIHNIKMIDSADLEIECNNMIQLMQNIKRKFTKKD